MTTETEALPTMTTVEDAKAFLADLATRHEWVSVLWDKGWGDAPLEITIIADGNGQKPLAHVTPEVYAALREDKTIAANSLMTYKKRRVHDYKTPPPDEDDGPNPADVFEAVIREFLDANPTIPLRVRLFRALERGPRGPVVREEEITSEAGRAAGVAHVLLCPGAAEVAVSARTYGPLGYDIISDGGIARRLYYPRTPDGAVGIDALTGEAFRAELSAAIAAKVAVLNTVATP